MSSAQALAGKKKELLKHWFQTTVDSYPADTARFLKDQSDPFANPVGHSLRMGTQGIFEALLDGSGEDEIREHVDSVVKIRAVQQISALNRSVRASSE